jgi:hypothetical protein
VTPQAETTAMQVAADWLAKLNQINGTEMLQMLMLDAKVVLAIKTELRKSRIL